MSLNESLPDINARLNRQLTEIQFEFERATEAGLPVDHLNQQFDELTFQSQSYEAKLMAMAEEVVKGLEEYYWMRGVPEYFSHSVREEYGYRELSKDELYLALRKISFSDEFSCESRGRAIETLKFFSDNYAGLAPALTGLLDIDKRFQDDKHSSHCLFSAREALKSMGDQAVPALIRVLESDSDQVHEAITVITNIGEQASAAVPTLLKVLEIHNQRRKFGDTRYHEAMMSNVLVAFQMIGPGASSAITPALNIIADPTINGMTHHGAVMALGLIGRGNDKVIDLLTDRLKNHENNYQASIAAQALSHLGCQAVIPLINEKMINTKVERTRKNYERALARLEGREVL